MYDHHKNKNPLLNRNITHRITCCSCLQTSSSHRENRALVKVTVQTTPRPGDPAGCLAEFTTQQNRSSFITFTGPWWRGSFTGVFVKGEPSTCEGPPSAQLWKGWGPHLSPLDFIHSYGGGPKHVTRNVTSQNTTVKASIVYSL